MAARSNGAGAGLAEFKRVVCVAVNFLPVLLVGGEGAGARGVELRAAGEHGGEPPPHIFPPSSINNSLAKLSANFRRDNAARRKIARGVARFARGCDRFPIRERVRRS